MDVSRLPETLSWLRYDESTHKIQAKLVSVQSALQNVTNNPGDANAQEDLAGWLSELRSSLHEGVDRSDPAELKRIVEIGGGPISQRT